MGCQFYQKKRSKKERQPEPRFELGFPDSKSGVLNHCTIPAGLGMPKTSTTSIFLLFITHMRVSAWSGSTSDSLP